MLMVMGLGPARGGRYRSVDSGLSPLGLGCRGVRAGVYFSFPVSKEERIQCTKEPHIHTHFC